MQVEIFWDIRDWARAVARMPVKRDLLASYLFEPPSVLGNQKHPHRSDAEPYGSREDRSA